MNIRQSDFVAMILLSTVFMKKLCSVVMGDIYKYKNLMKSAFTPWEELRYSNNSSHFRHWFKTPIGYGIRPLNNFGSFDQQTHCKKNYSVLFIWVYENLECYWVIPAQIRKMPKPAKRITIGTGMRLFWRKRNGIRPNRTIRIPRPIIGPPLLTLKTGQHRSSFGSSPSMMRSLLHFL